MGNDAGALAGTFGEYDQDDREADEARSAPFSKQLRHDVHANTLSVMLACPRVNVAASFGAIVSCAATSL